MKKRSLLFVAAAGLIYITLSSDINGIGTNGFDCTGAESGNGNPTGCSASGFSCHGTVGASTPGITVTLELDSAGVTTSSSATGTGHYKPGYTYTVKITGVNTTTNNLPRFGFQVGAIKGATAAAVPENAGTLQSTGLPVGVHYLAGPGPSSFVVNVVEHDMQLSPTTGTGGTGTTYVETFTWTAPTTGTGTVSLWAALNAVNFDNLNSAADKWNTTNLVLSETDSTVVSHISAVASVENTMAIKAFPNPVTTNLNLQIENAKAGNCSIHVFDVSGRSVADQNVELSGQSQVANVNTSDWVPGLYELVIQKDGVQQIIRVVKNL